MPKDWRSTFCGRRCSKLRDLPTKTCEKCGSEFRKNPEYSYAVWEKIRHCSIKCRGNGKEKTILTCATCGSEFQKSQYWYKATKSYCSQACYWQSLRTERYPTARQSRKGLDFTHRQRTRLLELAEHRCQACRATEHLEADHIIPVWNEGTNATSNGQILCRPCHRQKTTSDVQAYWGTASR